MARGGDEPRIIDRRSRGRSVSPPPPGAGAISHAARSSRREVAPAAVRGCSVPPRRDEGGVSWRPELESLRVAALIEKPQAKRAHPQLRVLLSYALSRINKPMTIDDKVLDEFLQLVSEALLQADCSSKMVSQMVSELRSKLSRVDLASRSSKQIIHQVIYKELCSLIDAGVKPGFVPKKGKPSVVLVVGIEGSGKTSSSAKFAYYHQHKGYKPSLVCADTRGDEGFNQLKHMARQANIPFYGSHTELNPVKVALRGVEKLRKENSDLIIIDTRGGHISDVAFLSEICEIDKATEPDLVLLVVDAGGGRLTFDQAKTFKRKISVGSVILTKVDAHLKGGGALNALAAARLPVILLGTGKRIEEIEVFDVKLFVNHLLGNKAKTLSIDTEDMHKIFENLKLSDTERKSAIEAVKQDCLNACSAVLEKHKSLARQIVSLELKYKRLCDLLGEQDLKNTDIQSATSLEERHSLVLISLKSLEKEKDSRTKKLQVLLSKALSLWDFLGVTSSEQRAYKYMLDNLSLSVQEVNSLSSESLQKFESRVKELELKKAELVDQSRECILRKGQLYIRGGTEDRGGLKDLIKMTAAWESKHSEVILYEKEGLLIQLRKIEDNLSRLNSDVSGHGVAKSDTSMEESSSRSSSGMGHLTSSSSSSGRSDPDYMPESTESDVDMGEMASESSVSLGE